MIKDKILIINGPNLNMLGIRQPGIYGYETMEELRLSCVKEAKLLNVEVEFKQSNYEGEIVTWLNEAYNCFSGIIINPAAYGHTSIAILDALLALDCPKIEVHLSDLFKRESFRQFSYTALGCHKTISGLGTKGYILAIKELATKKEVQSCTS
jgi:3-dehydroquinate dehydratase II